MKHSNKSFSKALKEIMSKKDVVHRKLAAKTNYCFSYFCVLKKRKKHPPMETIKKIAYGLDIPPEYFLEYRINKVVELLTDKPNITDHVFEFASELAKGDNLKIAEKEEKFTSYSTSNDKAT